MSRWLFLGPLLGLLILGGCASDPQDDDVAPTLTPGGADVSLTASGGEACGAAGAHSIVHAAGEAVAIAVQSVRFTTSCRCQFTTTSDWGCSNQKHCESEYDLGGPNPTKCDRIDEQTQPIQDITATVDRSDCSLALGPTPNDAITSRFTVVCRDEGLALVRVQVRTSDGVREGIWTLDFTADGMCPPAPRDLPDAGVGEAGDADTGADGRDPADGGADGDAGDR